MNMFKGFLHSGVWPKSSREAGSFTSSTLVAGAIVLIGFFLVSACSSTPKVASDPSKQEVQGDADRFFNTMEKEEVKKESKEAKDAYP